MLLNPKALSPRFAIPPQSRYVEKDFWAPADPDDDPEYDLHPGVTKETEATAPVLDVLAAPPIQNIDLAKAYRKPPMPFGPRVVGYAMRWGDIGGPDTQPHHVDKRNREPHYLRFERGAFRRVLDSGINVDACLSHQREYPIACTSDGTLELREDDIGLWFCFAPNCYSNGQPRPLKARLNSMLVTDGLSTGGVFKGMSPAWLTTTSIEKWSTHKGLPLATIIDAGLQEISVAYDPVFPQTSCKLITVLRKSK